MRVIALCMLVACNAATPDIPWLHGLDNAVSSTGVGVPRSPADYNVEPGCGVAASREIELVVDVARSSGRETIVATYSSGIAVFDREDHLVMESPGYPCEGSADELDAVAVGDAFGTPMLALAATSGGHRETATWISLFRIGDKRLDAVFTGVVETRADDTVTTGSIYLLPQGLLYKRPGGPQVLWRIDPASKVYVPVLPDTPHDEPPLVSLR